MQAAELADQFVAGPQEQVIGVGEDDLRVKLGAGQIQLQDALHGGLRARRHEHRRFDDAVRCVQQPCPGTGYRTLGLNLKSHNLRVAQVLGANSCVRKQVRSTTLRETVVIANMQY